MVWCASNLRELAQSDLWPLAVEALFLAVPDVHRIVQEALLARCDWLLNLDLSDQEATLYLLPTK